MGTAQYQHLSPRPTMMSEHTVHEYHVAFLDPLLPQHSGQGLDLAEQLFVGVFLLLARDGRVPDDGRGVAMTVLDMSVNTIVRRRYLPIREPCPMRMTDATGELLGRLLHRLRRSLMPVQLLGLMSPERLRILERVRLNLILDVRCHGDSANAGPLAGPPLRRARDSVPEGTERQWPRSCEQACTDSAGRQAIGLRPPSVRF